ncbi:MAG: hypothetical protein IPL78_01725 [Chloroflexi bacterium]|nr:hypothetical protein [Chloroflexota bacterium]
MGKFLESEKGQQAKFKASSPTFSEAASADGLYKTKFRPFCLPREHSAENLFPGIRQNALDYFAAYQIKWHDAIQGNPSNHLCDSQVCCVNFLFPFADQPCALADMLRPHFPTLHTMLPIENGQYVAFEWIGQENYLGEKISRNGKRTRGANCTSADAAVMFQHTNGQRQIVLIEWKYTESYSPSSLKLAKSGTDRTHIYVHLFERDDCPINKALLPHFDDLFYEPFYQLMRQQFLAQEMERARELGADVVSVLHIAPAHNTDFHKVTSANLKTLGKTAMDVWRNLARPRSRFLSLSTEQLFGPLSAEQLPEMQDWLEYIGLRYIWVHKTWH